MVLPVQCHRPASIPVASKHETVSIIPREHIPNTAHAICKVCAQYQSWRSRLTLRWRAQCSFLQSLTQGWLSLPRALMWWPSCIHPPSSYREPPCSATHRSSHQFLQVELAPMARVFSHRAAPLLADGSDFTKHRPPSSIMLPTAQNELPHSALRSFATCYRPTSVALSSTAPLKLMVMYLGWTMPQQQGK